jgi:ribosomal protein S21
MACRVELRERGHSREDRDAAFRQMHSAFKRMVAEAGIISRWKEKEYYESPGEKRRRKRRKAEQERLKEKRKSQLRRHFG